MSLSVRTDNSSFRKKLRDQIMDVLDQLSE